MENENCILTIERKEDGIHTTLEGVSGMDIYEMTVALLESYPGEGHGFAYMVGAAVLVYCLENGANLQSVCQTGLSAVQIPLK